MRTLFFGVGCMVGSVGKISLGIVSVCLSMCVCVSEYDSVLASQLHRGGIE